MEGPSTSRSAGERRASALPAGVIEAVRRSRQAVHREATVHSVDVIWVTRDDSFVAQIHPE